MIIRLSVVPIKLCVSSLSRLKDRGCEFINHPVTMTKL